jgi:serine/threonine protein kinase
LTRRGEEPRLSGKGKLKTAIPIQKALGKEGNGRLCADIVETPAYDRPKLANQQVINGQYDNYAITHTSGKELPSGATAVVYEALRTRDARLVALKLFSPREQLTASDSETRLKLFENETKKLQSVSHWNIVRLLDSGKTQVDGRILPFSVLEFLPLTLEKALKNPMGQTDRLFYCAQLADAVAYLNFVHGFFHDDIKPANILLTESRLLKLSDLGAVVIDPKRLRQETRALGLHEEKPTFGHPRYAFSPEQVERFRSQKPVDLTYSDTFLLGRVCHEIMTGVYPTGQLNLSSAMYRDTPSHCRTVLRDMLLQETPRVRPDKIAWVFYMTLQNLLERLEKVMNHLKPDEVTMLKRFTGHPMDVRNPSRYLQDEAVRKLAQLKLVRIVLPRRLAENSYNYPFVEVRSESKPPQLAKIELTPFGIDVRNAILRTDTWVNFERNYFISEKQATSASVAYAKHIFKSVASRETRWDLSRTERDPSTLVPIDCGNGKGFYYVFRPLELCGRWYVEIQPSLSLRGAHGIPGWGHGYLVPWRVVDGDNRQSSLEKAQAILERAGVPKREARRVGAHQVPKPGYRLIVSARSLVSASLWEDLLPRDATHRIAFHIGPPPEPFVAGPTSLEVLTLWQRNELKRPRRFLSLQQWIEDVKPKVLRSEEITPMELLNVDVLTARSLLPLIGRVILALELFNGVAFSMANTSDPSTVIVRLQEVGDPEIIPRISRGRHERRSNVLREALESVIILMQVKDLDDLVTSGHDSSPASNTLASAGFEQGPLSRIQHAATLASNRP